MQAITYFCKLEGSSDFTMKADSVVLEPRQTASFPLEFASRFTRPVHAQVVFTSRRQGNAHAAAMVFKLKSQCTGRKPLKTFTVAAPLYEVGALEIDVDNPFPEDAEFLVSINSQLVEGDDRKPAQSKLIEPVESFFAQNNRLRLRASSSTKLTIQFLPLETGTFIGSLGLYDSRVGEFYYEVVGEATNPTPLESYKVQCKVEELQTKDIVLPFRNAQFERAKQWLDAGGRGNLGKLCMMPESVTYDVRLTSPFYTAPKQITIMQAQSGPVGAASSVPTKPTSKGGKKAAAAEAEKAQPDANSEKLCLEFKPREPGVYPCSVILTSNNDMRIYSIEGTGTAPNSRVALTFHTHARREVTQEIPIVNPTDKDWPIKATFTQTGGLAFDGPREFIARKRAVTGEGNGTKQYELGFQPLQAGIVTGCVMFKDPATGHYTWYTVELHVSPPKPQQALQLQCVVRQAVAMDIELVNPLDDVVVFDVRLHGDGLLGMEQFVLAPREAATYELVYSPLLPAPQSKGTAVFLNDRVGEFCTTCSS